MGQTSHTQRSLVSSSGFTLIELAVVLVIIGAVISIVATALPALIQSSKIKKNRAVLEKIDYAMEGYIAANGRLPCPDTDGDGAENRTPGSMPPSDDICTAYVGDLPYLTLGLSSGNDVWGNPFRYSVYEDLIRTTNTGLCAASPCTSCLRDFISNPNPAFLRTTKNGNSTNQAFAVVSGGPKDLDAPVGFFDGLNDDTDVEFESPDRIMDATYDDFVAAASLAYLQGRLCSGGTGSGGGSGALGENAYPDGCTNGTDDDADGHTDCGDQDCWGIAGCAAGGTDVVITTTSLPSGTVNSDYFATVQATGGTTPYEWRIADNGGFSGLFLHTYTGEMSGRLDQCPGTYPVQIQVEDATLPADGGPKSHVRSLNLNVTSALSISRTSGTGSEIQWLTAVQEETFQANGGYLGDIQWILDTGGADGFAVASTGANTCTIKKTGATTTGSGPYPFTLTATDSACTTGNTAQINLNVTIPASGSGAAAPYTEDLVAEWRLDECLWNGTEGEVVDSGTGALNGTSQSGAVTTGAGRSCRSGWFDGVNDHVNMGDVLNDILGSANGVFTVSAWIRPDRLTATATNHRTRNCFFAKASDGRNDNLEIGVNTDGTLHLYLDTSQRDRYADFGTPGDIDTGQWHFIAVSYDAGIVTVFINDRKYVDATTWSGGGNLDDASGSPVTIGSSEHINNYFSGYIDEVMVFDDALTDTEVETLKALTRTSCSGTCYSDPVAEYRMESGSWSGVAGEVIDSGSGASHGIAAAGGNGILPSQTDPTAGKLCRAGSFTRTNANHGGYLDLGDPADGDLDPENRPWTIGVWIHWDGSTGENIIYNKENLYEAKVQNGYVQYAWQPHWYWDGGQTFPVTANTWTHVTVVYDGIRQILYKNGVQVFQREETGVMGANSYRFLIGARGSTSPRYFFGGMIDELKIFDRALSESEIIGLMDEERTCE